MDPSQPCRQFQKKLLKLGRKKIKKYSRCHPAADSRASEARFHFLSLDSIWRCLPLPGDHDDDDNDDEANYDDDDDDPAKGF